MVPNVRSLNRLCKVWQLNNTSRCYVPALKIDEVFFKHLHVRNIMTEPDAKGKLPPAGAIEIKPLGSRLPFQSDKETCNNKAQTLLRSSGTENPGQKSKPKIQAETSVDLSLDKSKNDSDSYEFISAACAKNRSVPNTDRNSEKAVDICNVSKESSDNNDGKTSENSCERRPSGNDLNENPLLTGSRLMKMLVSGPPTLNQKKTVLPPDLLRGVTERVRELNRGGANSNTIVTGDSSWHRTGLEHENIERSKCDHERSSVTDEDSSIIFASVGDSFQFSNVSSEGSVTTDINHGVKSASEKSVDNLYNVSNKPNKECVVNKSDEFIASMSSHGGETFEIDVLTVNEMKALTVARDDGTEAIKMISVDRNELNDAGCTKDVDKSLETEIRTHNTLEFIESTTTETIAEVSAVIQVNAMNETENESAKDGSVSVNEEMADNLVDNTADNVTGKITDDIVENMAYNVTGKMTDNLVDAMADSENLADDVADYSEVNELLQIDVSDEPSVTKREVDKIYDLSLLFSGELEKRRKRCKKTQKYKKNSAKKSNGETGDDGQNGSEKRKSKPVPNYFVAVQIKDKKIRAALEDVQKQIVEGNGKLKPAIIRPSTFHITLMVLSLSTQEEINKSALALDEASNQLLSTYSSRSLHLDIAGLGHFRNEVLFAKVKSPAQVTELQNVAELVEEAHMSHGIVSPDAKGFKPHLTIAKLSKVKGLKKKGIKKIDESLYKSFLETDFGSQAVSTLQLCSMLKPKDKLGYYHVEHAVEFGHVSGTREGSDVEEIAEDSNMELTEEKNNEKEYSASYENSENVDSTYITKDCEKDLKVNKDDGEVLKDSNVVADGSKEIDNDHEECDSVDNHDSKKE